MEKNEDDWMNAGPEGQDEDYQDEDSALYDRTLFVRLVGGDVDIIVFYDKNNKVYTLKGKSHEESVYYKSSNLNVFESFVARVFLINIHANSVMYLIDCKEELSDTYLINHSSLYLSNTDYDTLCPFLRFCFGRSGIKRKDNFTLLKSIHHDFRNARISEIIELLNPYLLMSLEIH
jgi:hypothetical protein